MSAVEDVDLLALLPIAEARQRLSSQRLRARLGIPRFIENQKSRVVPSNLVNCAGARRLRTAIDWPNATLYKLTGYCHFDGVDKVSKEDIVHTTLVGMSRRLGPNAKLPTVVELCKKLSVSRSTLDRVLRVLERERILICRHGSGIFVSPFSNQQRIGIIFSGDIYNPQTYSQFWSLLHHSAMQIVESRGDELRSYYDCPSEGNGFDPGSSTFSLIDDLESNQLSGLILTGVNDPEKIQWLRKWRIPIVTLGEIEGGDGQVSFDPRMILRMGFQGFRENGCQRIALVTSGVPDDKFAAETDHTTVAFRELAEETGVTYEPGLRWFYNLLAPFTGWDSHEDAGGKLMRQLWNRPGLANPDGLFFTDDTCAHGALITLLKMGVVPGRDVQVAVQTNKGVSLLRPFYENIFRIQIDPTQVISEMLRLMDQIVKVGSSRPPMVFVPSVFLSPNSAA